MVKLIIIFLFLFTIGNIVAVPLNEPKLFWIPCAVLLWLLVYLVKTTLKKHEVVNIYFINYFFALATFNIVKQIFYSERMKQVNDFILGGISTLILLIFLIKWAIQNHKNGGTA